MKPLVLFTILSYSSTLINAKESYPDKSGLGETSPNNALLPRQRDLDKETIASWSEQGLCMYYPKNDGNREKMLAPCKVWCPKKNPDMNPDAVGVRLPNS
jgi:hypothetical protein